MGPSERGDVREEIGGAIQPDPLPRDHGSGLDGALDVGVSVGQKAGR